MIPYLTCNVYWERFDLFFAVFAPIVMLVYAYYNFKMDRDNFATREETLTPGSFDRIARLFADPIQVQLVKTSFANLQITEGEYILVKCFLNLLGIYKWKKVIAHLILANRMRREEKGGAIKNHGHPHSRMHTMLGGIIFICCSFGIAIYTALSLSTSIRNCSPYDYCRVYSYRWEWGKTSTCPCIVYIDRELAPKTFDEWINAPDVTDSLSSLASNGYLQTVQIVNRALPELPEELRKCTRLKDLYVTVYYTSRKSFLTTSYFDRILIYTKTRRFSEWAQEFTHLQYLYVIPFKTHENLTAS
ncbi:unnamed protein product [Phytophthora lilii]|uniref:Unnamed protein product n=1 Tax=Phytophthora lilii TaxID=2077276 RepID=A0A9W6XY59_9STRA|nr:unnamed protein product [Phytophthora lilii]